MRLVLLTVADAANRDGEHAHPGLAAIVEGSLYGRAHVLATLARLLDEGWLVVEEEGGGRGRATVYRIPGVLAKVQPVDGSGNGPIRGNSPASEAKGSNHGSERVQSEAASLYSPTVVTTVDTNRREAEADFATFWERYPSRRGTKRGRGAALTQWLRLSAERREVILRAVDNFAAFCDHTGEYPPDAHRWLKGDLWDDWRQPFSPLRPNGTGNRGPSTEDFLALAAGDDQ